MAAATHASRTPRTPRTTPKKRAARAHGHGGGRWSQHVTETSDAMTLEEGVFRKKSPRAIALSLKRSAEASHRRRFEPYRSAMSMLTFYLNRGGKNLDEAQKRILERAKDELRRLFGRAETDAH